jgi:hypothetical protein
VHVQRQQDMFEGDGVVTKDFEGSEKVLRREQEGARNLRAHTRGTRGLARSSDRVARLPTWDPNIERLELRAHNKTGSKDAR